MIPENLKKYITNQNPIVSMTKNHLQTYTKTIGKEGLALSLMEECGELQKALSKIRRTEQTGKPANTKEIANLCEETAHVQMVLQTIMYTYHLTPKNINDEIVKATDKYYSKKPETPKENWFQKITDHLRDYSEGDIWSDGNQILCKTESAANTIADMLATLYKTQGDSQIICTGYYDPEEDERNQEVDRYTGWWYVCI